jgi:hypothetical protein
MRSARFIRSRGPNRESHADQSYQPLGHRRSPLPNESSNLTNGTLSGRVRATRALGPLKREVRGPAPTSRKKRSGFSFDDLISSQQKRWRDRQSQSLHGFQIDHELELRRLLHRKIGRSCAPQDTIHVARK